MPCYTISLLHCNTLWTTVSFRQTTEGHIICDDMEFNVTQKKALHLADDFNWIFQNEIISILSLSAAIWLKLVPEYLIENKSLYQVMAWHRNRWN